MPAASEADYRLTPIKRSMIAISTVALVEVIMGLAVGSLAIVSDGLHATLDAVTMVLLFVAIRESMKPPDEEHMYGHEKFESIGGLAGGIVLLGVAFLIMYEAILKILEGQTINWELKYVGWIAIGYTFCIDFFRVGTMLKARNKESFTMKAGLYHAIADLGSTVIALLGFGLASLGFYYGDSLASMVLSALLCCLSVRLVWSSGMELSDTISKDVANKIREEILGTKGVCQLKELKLRKAGEKAFVRATVQVPDYLNLDEAHDLTSEIETKIRAFFEDSEISIHTEPYEAEMPTRKLVEKLAQETEGVKEVHEIDTTYINGRLFITLHICVDPRLTVADADDIAEKIEDKVERMVQEVENVTVHLEPSNLRKTKGSVLNEDELNKAIHEAFPKQQEFFRIKRIVTYVADQKRYVNIDCSFTKRTSVEEAHKIALEIQNRIMARLSETIVTVHTE